MQLKDLVVFFFGEKIASRDYLVALNSRFHARDVWAVVKFIGVLAQNKLNVA